MMIKNLSWKIRHIKFSGTEIQTDYQNPLRRANLVLINKKKTTGHLVHLVVPEDHALKFF